MASIKFDNVSFAYGNNQILRNFSLEVDDRDRKSTRLNSSHIQKSRMPSSA